VQITLADGRTLAREQSDFEGSPTRPMSWNRVVEKFHWLAEPFADETLRSEIICAVERLGTIAVSELTGMLGAVSPTPRRQRSRGRL
jgi:2-methylcitrate dehydratase